MLSALLLPSAFELPRKARLRRRVRERLLGAPIRVRAPVSVYVSSFIFASYVWLKS